MSPKETCFKITERAFIKIIRFDPLAPVKITALLLSVERKMPHFISYNEYLEPI